MDRKLIETYCCVGGSETFKDKQDFFYHEVRQLHHKRLHDKLTIKINRSNLLESVSGFKAHPNLNMQNEQTCI